MDPLWSVIRVTVPPDQSGQHIFYNQSVSRPVYLKEPGNIMDLDLKLTMIISVNYDNIFKIKIFSFISMYITFLFNIHFFVIIIVFFRKKRDILEQINK